MTLKIEKLVYGGEGLGHSEGNTVFVPFVLPGEEVAFRPIERKKKFVRAALTQVVTPAADRATPSCPHFTHCGGCHYQHIPYESQLAHKSQILRETLARLGRVTWEGEIHTHASPPLGYRNRAQWKVRWADEGGAQRGVVGYHRGGSAAVLGVEQCPILAPALQETLQSLRHAVGSGSLPASLREVEAFSDAAGKQLLLNASFTDIEGNGRKLFEKLREVAPAAASILLHNTQKDAFHLEGPGFLPYPVGNDSFRVGHLSFFQINRFLLEEMVAAVTASESGETALDLFAGVGLFSVPLARKFARTIAVEANEAAVRDLAGNIEAAGVTVQAVTAEAGNFLSGHKQTADLVVLDPPRAGIGAETVASLRRIAAPRITYLSCDPATLARDLSGLLDKTTAGSSYRIREVHLFDIFPQTFHIETLVHLEAS